VKNIEKSDVGTWLMSKHNEYLKDAIKHESPRDEKDKEKEKEKAVAV
jgi:hypothetical protein